MSKSILSKPISSFGKLLLVLGTVAALGQPAVAQDNEFAEPLTALANAELRAIAQNPAIVAAVEAQNAQTAAYDEAKILELDTQWRAEVTASAKPLIDATLATEASKLLTQLQADSAARKWPVAPSWWRKLPRSSRPCSPVRG